MPTPLRIRLETHEKILHSQFDHSRDQQEEPREPGRVEHERGSSAGAEIAQESRYLPPRHLAYQSPQQIPVGAPVEAVERIGKALRFEHPHHPAPAVRQPPAKREQALQESREVDIGAKLGMPEKNAR